MSSILKVIAFCFKVKCCPMAFAYKKWGHSTWAQWPSATTAPYFHFSCSIIWFKYPQKQAGVSFCCCYILNIHLQWKRPWQKFPPRNKIQGHWVICFKNSCRATQMDSTHRQTWLQHERGSHVQIKREYTFLVIFATGFLCSGSRPLRCHWLCYEHAIPFPTMHMWGPRYFCSFRLISESINAS